MQNKFLSPKNLRAKNVRRFPTNLNGSGLNFGPWLCLPGGGGLYIWTKFQGPQGGLYIWGRRLYIWGGFIFGGVYVVENCWALMLTHNGGVWFRSREEFQPTVCLSFWTAVSLREGRLLQLPWRGTRYACAIDVTPVMGEGESERWACGPQRQMHPCNFGRWKALS